ncbi:unnamed protein product [Gongylonema pulchrum]|uniref:Macoilin n=1 Tax=Gongylonema pulchrum TaxID=637853 RepID=A0A183D2C4_9BILA|nr:unnamed protein product [Gongylonema pulchrum]
MAELLMLEDDMLCVPLRKPLVSFEYCWRYRGDTPWQLLKGSAVGSTLDFLTGGSLSSWLGFRQFSHGELAEIGDSSRERRPAPEAPRIFGSAATAGGFLGGFGVALTAAFAQSPSLTSDLCRPFAAHCIGYPVVTFGFGLKTYFRLWRVKRRQREVSRANEVHWRILAEALPSKYEGPRVYQRRSDAVLQEQEQIGWLRCLHFFSSS